MKTKGNLLTEKNLKIFLIVLLGVIALQLLSNGLKAKENVEENVEETIRQKENTSWLLDQQEDTLQVATPKEQLQELKNQWWNYENMKNECIESYSKEQNKINKEANKLREETGLI